MTQTPTTDFTILANTADSWDVQFRISKTVMLDKESLLNHLRGIKHDIAIEFDTSETRMVFDGILHKEESNEFVDVVVRIKQIDVEKGDPVIHFKEGIALNGVRYPKMRALMDLYCLDAQEQMLTLKRIHKAINEAQLDWKLVQQDTVLGKLKDVLNSYAAIKNVQIAAGHFAEIGKDADIEFLIPVSADLDKLEEYFSSKRVVKGDVLCRLTPAQYGKQRGVNVVGEIIEPPKGLDIELDAGFGVRLSSDGTEAIADEDGIAIVTREMHEVKTPFGAKAFPNKVALRVNPVLKVEGNDVLDIETSKTVEIVGNLRMGSRVLTCCGIHVNGDIEKGTLLAGHDIVINGEVSDSTISSDTSLIVQGIISNSDLKAKGKLIIDGEVKDSSISGDAVQAGTVSNTTIIAQSKVTIDRTEAEDDQAYSKIYVGMNEFYEQRIRENEKFLQMAQDKLARIEMVVGKENMAQITTALIQNRLMKILSHNQRTSNLGQKRQAAAFRKLLESIPAMQEMMQWKEAENMLMRTRLQSSKDSESNRVIIKERIGSRTMISVNGVEAEVSPWDGPIQFYVDDDKYLQMEQGDVSDDNE